MCVCHALTTCSGTSSEELAVIGGFILTIIPTSALNILSHFPTGSFKQGGMKILSVDHHLQRAPFGGPYFSTSRGSFWSMLMLLIELKVQLCRFFQIDQQIGNLCNEVAKEK